MTWLVDPINLFIIIENSLAGCFPVCWCVQGDDLLCTCFRGRCDVKYDASLTKEDL